MHTFDRSARRTALSCAGASVKPVFPSHHLIARSGSIAPKDCGASATGVDLGGERLGDLLHGDAHELLRVEEQVGLGRPAVPRLLGLRLERMHDRGARAQGRVVRHAHRPRDAVRRREANSPDVAAEAVGIRLDDGDGVVAVLAVDLRGLRDGDAVRLREDHQLARAARLTPGLADLLDLLRTELGDLAEAAGVVLEYVDRVGAELVDDAVGEHGADAVDQSAREIAAHAFRRLRRNAGDALRLELAAAHGVVHPLTHGVQFLALPRRRTGAEHSDLALGEAESPVLGKRDVQDGEAVVVVAEDDALHRPVDGRQLLGRAHSFFAGACGAAGSAATWTFLMTMGSSGTFWWGPAKPVFTFAILSTTSMPSVTLPNTA